MQKHFPVSLLTKFTLVFMLLALPLTFRVTSQVRARVVTPAVSTMNRELSAAVLAAPDKRLIQQLLNETKALPSVGARMSLISARLVGRPYIVHPLIGSHTEPEQFVTRVDGFDCVTFLETVLALANARDVDSYLQQLRLIRYDAGKVGYNTRLHYTTDWNRAHIQRGFLQDLSQNAGSVERTKTLSLLPGFAPRASTFRYYPKTALNAVSRWLNDGDLIYFVSTANGLDTYHVGMLFNVNGQWVMRHAAKSRGRVVEQSIAEFCQQNRMSGFILARPVDTLLSRR